VQFINVGLDLYRLTELRCAVDVNPR